MYKKIILKCKVVTPLFMGGAQQQPELRTQSFNGLFRYWFRLIGGSFDEEKKYFGWGADKNANKGLVSIDIDMTEGCDTETFSKKFERDNSVINNCGINYIGFSVDQRFKKNEYKKQIDYINENQEFILCIKFHPFLEDKDIIKYLSAVWCAFYLGNYGTRSRRGFGSIIITNVEKKYSNKDYEYVINFIPGSDLSSWILTNFNNIKKILTGIEKNSRRKDLPFIFEDLKIFHIQKNNFLKYKDWTKEIPKFEGKYVVKNWNKANINNKMDLLDFLGFLLLVFRNYNKIDYEIVKGLFQNKKSSEKPLIQKAAFGLPINYFFSSIKAKGMIEVKGEKAARRASPLTLKVIETANGEQFEGYFVLFNQGNWKFLPDNAKVELNGVRLGIPDFGIIHQFFDGLLKYDLVKEIKQ